MDPNLQKLMQQAQKLQTSMQEAQKELASMTVQGSAGGDMVKITMTGQHYVKKVEINPTIAKGLSAQDKEMLEDLIAAATNDAVARVEKRSKEKISGLASSLGTLPDGFKLPGDEG